MFGGKGRLMGTGPTVPEGRVTFIGPTSEISRPRNSGSRTSWNRMGREVPGFSIVSEKLMGSPGEMVVGMVGVRWIVACCALKMAETDLAVSIVTVHWLPFVESQPDQLVKVEPVVAVAVRVTLAPLLYVAEPVLPFQVIEPVFPVTDPLPVPDLVMVRLKVEPGFVIGFPKYSE